MDIITQGLLGAVVAQSVSKPNELRCASLIGFCAPLLADADALLRSPEDQLLFLEYHRHFSHSLIFIPLGALIASVLLWPFLRHKLAFNKIYLYALLGYGTAGILDACTSYGTHLLWPFNDERIAWSIVSIFDPLFSLGLIAVLAFSIVKYQPRTAMLGITFAVSYLLLGAFQHERATSLALIQAQQRGHHAERLIVKPTMGNLVLWRSIYLTDGVYYVDAVRVGLGNGRVFEGNEIAAFNINRDLPHLPNQSVLYKDIQRFDFFSDGFLAWHPERANILGDVRYSMLPTSVRPLWGIEMNINTPNQHVTFNNYRNMSEVERTAFVEMLFD